MFHSFKKSWMVSNSGSAPVVDPCGLAGGTPFGTWAPEWGNYVNTTYASHGDYGSKVLPEFPTNLYCRVIFILIKWEIMSAYF